ncbi:MAG TPA: DUF485 domain-containing protein [Azospirillaceae bacterium]|nr:DUF485 domain-containing protein [Azospirillaceae bacterium]
MRRDLYDRVLAHPQFAELTARRNRFSWALTLIVLAVYYAFVFTVAYRPDLLGAPLADGMTLTLGLVGGAVINVFCFLMTGIYVTRANGEFDTLNRAILEEAGQ